MKSLDVIWGLALALVLGIAAELAAQQVFTIDMRSVWEEDPPSWDFPRGAMELTASGSIRPLKFEQPFNAALNAGDFTHTLKQGEVTGGVWQAGTNLTQGRNVIDNSPNTFWQPSQAASVDDWWIDIDLGRLVMVKEIVLHFPDQEGARPLREFRVFSSDGRNQSVIQDLFSFLLVGGTTRWNERTEVTYPVSANSITKRVLTLGQPGPEDDTTVEFGPVQYLRIIVDAKTEEAALAEVEVISFGQNIGLGTTERGGIVDDGKERTAGLFDGDVNVTWEVANTERGRAIELVPDPDNRVGWNWHLGATYWINRVVVISDQLRSTQVVPRIMPHRLLGSDGRIEDPSRVIDSEDLTKGVDFDILFDYPDLTTWPNPQPVTYLMFPYQRLSNIYMLFLGRSSGGLSEVAIYPVGHVAAVQMESGFIEISRSPKILQTLEWEAELPEETRILAQTRSGNEVGERFEYYNTRGKKMDDKEAYDGLNNQLKGDIKTFPEAGQDWSSWSNVYQFSGQKFLSPSPRRYVQFRLVLDSTRPEAAPTLRSLSLNLTDAFLASARGQVEPREAVPGVPQLFSYLLQPEFASGDRGFDRLLVLTPSQAHQDSLFVRVGGEQVEPKQVVFKPDSLVIELSETVRRDSVQIDFKVNVLENPYQVNVFVGNTQSPELWQNVDPQDRYATSVFLPNVPGLSRLIDNVSVNPPILTPNDDGIGDELEVRFSVLKVQIPAQVQIYSLDGQVVGDLDGRLDADGLWSYTWSGDGPDGRLVPPGHYLCRIKLDAEVDTPAQLRVVRVAY